MINKAQGLGLSLITKLAGSDVLDQLKLRKFLERSLYQGSKAGFRALSQTQKVFKPKQIPQQRLPQQKKNLFDLSLTEEQQMTSEAMSQFAQEVLLGLAHDADQTAQFPESLWQYVEDLGLNYYALPEALGGVAAEQNIVSNLLIAEKLAEGDFSLTAGLLSRLVLLMPLHVGVLLKFSQCIYLALQKTPILPPLSLYKKLLQHLTLMF